MKPRAVRLAAFVVLAACRSSVRVEPEPSATAPSASAVETDPKAPPRLVISPAGARFDGDADLLARVDADPNAGFEASSKRGGAKDLYVVPIANAIDAARSAKRLDHSLAVSVDPKTTYRVLIEALFTAGQREIGQFTLVDTSPNARSFGFAPPAMTKGPPVGMTEGLNPVLLVVDDGVSLKVAGGNVGPGCDGPKAGLAFPRTPSGTVDAAAIRACVERLVAAYPKEPPETRVVVTAKASIPFSDIVDVVYAVRTRFDGKPLLPDVTFGVSR